MTPKAAEAFDDFVSLGPSRSLRKLIASYRQRSANESPTVRFETLAEWSSRYQWQDRLVSATTALTEARLECAAELDAGSFLKTSELIADTLAYTTRHNLDAVLAIRQAVRKPTPKGTTVNVNVLVAELVQKYGLEGEAAAAFDADVRAHLAATRAGVV